MLIFTVFILFFPFIGLASSIVNLDNLEQVDFIKQMHGSTVTGPVSARALIRLAAPTNFCDVSLRAFLLYFLVFSVILEGW